MNKLCGKVGLTEWVLFGSYAGLTHKKRGLPKPSYGSENPRKYDIL